MYKICFKHINTKIFRIGEFSEIQKISFEIFIEDLILEISEHYGISRIKKFALVLELQHIISNGVCATSIKGTNAKSSFLKMAFFHLARTLTY